MKRPPKMALVMAVSLSGGCLNPFSTRVPEITPRPPEYERRESQIQDPYPERDIGPDVGFRPREYQQQRPEIQRTKDRSYSAYLRDRARAVPSAPMTPGMPVP